MLSLELGKDWPQPVGILHRTLQSIVVEHRRPMYRCRSDRSRPWRGACHHNVIAAAIVPAAGRERAHG